MLLQKVVLLLVKIMAGTAWSTSWDRTLLRLPNAEKVGPKKFAGVTSRGVQLPVDDFE